MKLTYQKPFMTINAFDVEDIITASAATPGNDQLGGGDVGWDEENFDLSFDSFDSMIENSYQMFGPQDDLK